MPRPKIRPITAEAAAASQAAIDSFGNVFIPEGADKYDTKNGTGHRWSARLEITKAWAGFGGSRDEPDEGVTVYSLMTKAVPFEIAPDKNVPAGTAYFLSIRIDNEALDAGDEMAMRNQGVLVSLFAALGLDVKTGLTQEVIESAFPEKTKGAESTLRGQRAFASLSFNPPNKEGARGFLNVDRFLPDVEA